MIGFIGFLALLIAGALAAWALWLAELFHVKGVTGPAWAESFSWSALPICAVIAAASSYLVTPSAPRRQRLLFIATTFALSFAAFVAARWAFIDMFTRRRGFIPGPLNTSVLWLASLILAGGLAAAADRWLAPLWIWAVALISIALFLVLPLSVAMVEVLPDMLEGSMNEKNVFKAGYPVFWIALLLPFSLRLGRKRVAATA